jgi:pimeloyl-ACP methyl ester carboxylesterase
MREVFTEPDSEDVVAELVAIALEATPEVISTQARECDWLHPARLLGRVSCPTLAIHGDSDALTPVTVAEDIVDAMPDARLELIEGGGHRPDIRSPELVNPLLMDFLFSR